MLRWILGGREASSSVEKSPVLCIGEEQPKNRFTELQVLKGHFDIVRFLVQIDDFRFASAGDDGVILVWSIETGEKLQELRGHSQQITAISTFTCSDGVTWLISASSDRSLSLWDPNTGNRVHTLSDLQSSVKCLLVLERLSVWVSGGDELCVWDKRFQLQCHRQKNGDAGVSVLIELPKNCLAAAVDTHIVIHSVTISADRSVSLTEVCRLSSHTDQIRALIHVNDGLFASGSHAGELMFWDSSSWSNLACELIRWEESQGGSQLEMRLGARKPSDMSIQHLSTDGKLVLAAVGSGLYVYDVVAKMVVAYRRNAHDSNVLHTMLLSDSELMSCSEDGSVRMWEIQDLPLPAEPASAGFFGMWSFGRQSRPSGPQGKRVRELPDLRVLELSGDLIGHSGAVQMFLSFGEGGVATCSTDHLLILWRDGERQSRLRSEALFHKLEENGGLS